MPTHKSSDYKLSTVKYYIFYILKELFQFLKDIFYILKEIHLKVRFFIYKILFQYLSFGHYKSCPN